jgi:hypothetical protein
MMAKNAKPPASKKNQEPMGKFGSELLFSIYTVLKVQVKNSLSAGGYPVQFGLRWK